MDPPNPDHWIELNMYSPYGLVTFCVSPEKNNDVRLALIKLIQKRGGPKLDLHAH